MMYSVTSIYNSFQIYDKDFVTTNKNYLILNVKDIKVKDYLEYEKYDDINYILPGNSETNFRIKYDDYYQTEYLEDSTSGSLSSISMIDVNDIKYGSIVINDDEVILDEMIIKKLFESIKIILKN